MSLVYTIASNVSWKIHALLITILSTAATFYGAVLYSHGKYECPLLCIIYRHQCMQRRLYDLLIFDTMSLPCSGQATMQSIARRLPTALLMV